MNQTDAASALAPDAIPPLPENATPEEKDQHWYKYVYQGDNMPQLTVRAVVMGGLIGMAMCCAHLYTVLAIGWSFGVAITACVMSYVTWNVVRILSGHLVSRLFGVAIALGGLAVVTTVHAGAARFFTTAKMSPAMIEPAAWCVALAIALAGLGVCLLLWRKRTPMSILENNCMQSTASAAGFSTGSTMATAFGALLLLNGVQVDWRLAAAFTLTTGAMGVWLAIPMKRSMINHEQLPFPSGIAAATTLKSLYSHGAEALRKAYGLLLAMAGGMLVGVLKVGDQTLEKLTSLRNLYKYLQDHGIHIRLPGQIPNNGFYSVNEKQLVGFGFDPSVLLLGAGMIVGLRVSLSMLVGSMLLYFWVGPSLINYDILHGADPGYVRSIELVSGGTIYQLYRWGLWGGTAVMVCSSLTAVALRWQTIKRSFAVFRGARESDAVKSTMDHVEVPTSWFVGGLIPIMSAMLLVQYIGWGINPVLGIIAIGMAFVLSLVASRSSGETDTTPTGAMGKVMQLLFAVLSPGNVPHNLISAGIAANSASAGSDLLGDLKSGYLLGANPRRQFLAQFFGIFFGTVAIIPCWYLMIPDKEALQSYPAPATNQWRAVAELLTKGIDQLPESARIAIVIGALIGVALPLIERTVPRKVRPYFPSAMGLGLSWVIPFNNALSFAVGATIPFIWGLISRRTRDSYSVPVASGLVAGESLIQGVIAMLATAIGIAQIGQKSG
ncbi:MAG: OPT/YSL family transporter [Planctomycetes bacterium]|nr:OPT/YSL family transporter [Planctomycetota bacterium]